MCLLHTLKEYTLGPVTCFTLSTMIKTPLNASLVNAYCSAKITIPLLNGIGFISYNPNKNFDNSFLDTYINLKKWLLKKCIKIYNSVWTKVEIL